MLRTVPAVTAVVAFLLISLITVAATGRIAAQTSPCNLAIQICL